jgi:outer membrane lipase/esterase
MPRLRHLSGAIIAAFAFASAAQATDFSKVVVFGDSLSDNGNLSLALSPTTSPNRFTTNPGLVAMEHVAAN